MSLRSVARVITVSLVVLIAILSLTPHTEDLEGATDFFGHIMAFLFGKPQMGDKLAHFAAYGALASMATIGMANNLRSIIAVFVSILFYGVALEFGQSFIGIRETDALDLIANFGGVLAGVTSGALTQHLFPKWFLNT